MMVCMSPINHWCLFAGGLFHYSGPDGTAQCCPELLQEKAADEATSSPVVREHMYHQHALFSGSLVHSSTNNVRMVVELLAVADQNVLCMFHLLLLDVCICSKCKMIEWG